METKHTKGEWKISKRSKTRIEVNDRTIAETGGYRSNPDNDNKTENENEANAKLIAAAPEMLEALQLLLKEYEDVKMNTPIAFYKVLTAAEEAIKKATE